MHVVHTHPNGQYQACCLKKGCATCNAQNQNSRWSNPPPLQHWVVWLISMWSQQCVYPRKIFRPECTRKRSNCHKIHLSKAWYANTGVYKLYTSVYHLLCISYVGYFQYEILESSGPHLPLDGSIWWLVLRVCMSWSTLGHSCNIGM